MTQNTIKRPRVAAIALNESQIESIAPLCGTLRPAGSLEGYLERYNWTETDITILGDSLDRGTVRGNVLTIEPSGFTWTGHDSSYPPISRHLGMHGNNTERETRIPEACPKRYSHLAAGLARRLGSAEDPPQTLVSGMLPKESVLVETTSGLSVAMRCVFEKNPETPKGWTALALVLPKEVDLSAWFWAFLADVHELDPTRVPQAPPRLGNPSDWYTPQERSLAKRIVEIADEIEHLEVERERIENDLDAASKEADAGIRRCIWADGDDLVASVGDILEKLGFVVCHMDAEQEQGKPKREDLSLTLADRPGWEAIAEIKGYTKGTRTNDARQIREHRDRYIGKRKSPPDLTLWIANTHRDIDPSSRPVPDSNVGEAAENIGAVHVLTTDLYRLWALVATGSIEKAQAVQLLIGADPGRWSLPALDAD